MDKKKTTLIVLILALLACISFDITFAYLTRVTESRVNNFAFNSDSLKAKLTESAWDGVQYYDPDDGKTPIYGLTKEGDPIYGYIDGDTTKPVTDKDDITPNVGRPRGEGIAYGDELAMHMIPGSSAPKNPIITNTGNLCDEWVSMKITFVYADGTPNEGKPLSATDLLNLMDIIHIDYDTGDSGKWERMEGTETSISQAFHYKQIIRKALMEGDYVEGGKTSPLFTAVTVDTAATAAQIDAIHAIGGFAIFIEGFAAQSNVAYNYAEYKEWAKTGVVFPNTPTNQNPPDVARPGIIPAG